MGNVQGQSMKNFVQLNIAEVLRMWTNL